MKYQIYKLGLNIEGIRGKREFYLETCPTPTYKGFLRFLGLGVVEFKELVELANDCVKSTKWRDILRELENFKLDMEVKMEEYLLYQYKHPDLAGCHNYNFGLLRDLLKYSNPSYYGNDRILALENKPAEKNIVKILENRSQVKWSK